MPQYRNPHFDAVGSVAAGQVSSSDPVAASLHRQALVRLCILRSEAPRGHPALRSPVHRDEQKIADLKTEVGIFLAEIEATIDRIGQLFNSANFLKEAA